MRDKITEKLEEWQNSQLDIPKDQRRIFYGQKPSNVTIEDWNYVVFGMEDIDKSGNNSMDLSRYFFVDIIRENFLSDEIIFGIIESMEEIPGMKLVKGSNPIDYVTKGNTDIVCEMIRLRFVKPMKRENLNNG